MLFVNAINGAKQTHDDDQIIIPSRRLAAFEWKMNQGWNAEERFQQCIHLEESKDPQLWQGPLAQRLQELKAELKDNWSTKKRSKAFNDCMDVNSHELSDKEIMLFRWMCTHVTLDGTPTSNPKSGNVFDYWHLALNYNSDFVLDSIQGTGLTGMYAASGYTVSEPMLDTWMDERLDYVWEQFPIPEAMYSRAAGDYQKFMKAIVRCVGSDDARKSILPH